MTDIFVHVPKTAGISLRTAVVDHYPDKSVFIYSTNFRRFIRAERHPHHHQDPHSTVATAASRLPAPLLRAALELRRAAALPPDKACRRADALIGHFNVHEFDGVEAAQDATWLTVVRHPLDRMVSHYRHVRRQGSPHPVLNEWWGGQDAGQPFRIFALSESVRNFQSRFTGEDPSKFDHLGTTENIAQFMVEADLIASKDDIPAFNRSTEGEHFQELGDPGFVRDFEQFHSVDYEFYDAARQGRDL